MKNHSKTKKGKKHQKRLLTSFQVKAAPINCSKYTTCRMQKLCIKLNQDVTGDKLYVSVSQSGLNSFVAELTEQELLDALMTCSDSAPGSDGIPYSVYKKTWSIIGPYIDRVPYFHQ